MDQPVEDAVGKRGIADLLAPVRHGELRSQDRRAHLLAILADLPEVAALGFCQRGHGRIVDYQHIDSAEPVQNAPQAAVGSCYRQVPEQRLGASVERRVTIAACLLRQSTRHKALAHPRWPQNENVLVRPDPSGLLRQGTDHTLIETPSGAVVDLLNTSVRRAQLGILQASGERLVLFISESRRNAGKPISIWAWSKVVHELATESGVMEFTTHTSRYLCLTVSRWIAVDLTDCGGWSAPVKQFAPACVHGFAQQLEDHRSRLHEMTRYPEDGVVPIGRSLSQFVCVRPPRLGTQDHR